MTVKGFVPIRIGPGQVQEVDSGEYDEEAGQERNDTDSIRRVEAAEEDEGRTQRCGGEGYIVEGIDTIISTAEMARVPLTYW